MNPFLHFVFQSFEFFEKGELSTEKKKGRFHFSKNFLEKFPKTESFCFLREQTKKVGFNKRRLFLQKDFKRKCYSKRVEDQKKEEGPKKKGGSS